MTQEFSNLFTKHVTLIVTECTTTRYSEYPEDDSYSEEEFVISTRKLEQWLNDELMGSCNIRSFRYIERIVREALASGATTTITSQKFSMGDTSDWWEDFLIKIEESVDPIQNLKVEINKGDF